MSVNINFTNSAPSNVRDDIPTLAWAPFTLSANWSSFGSGNAVAAYRKHASGLIEIKGLLTRSGTPTANEAIATLPTSCTPLENRFVPTLSTVNTSSFQLGGIEIQSNGNIAYITGSTGYFSFEYNFKAEKYTGVDFGDSITAGYGLSSPTTQRWSYLVSNSLGIYEDNQGIPGSPLQNSGASGSTVPGIIGNGYDTYQARILNRYPDKLFIAYGTNDMFDTLAGASLAVFKTQYQAILTAVFAANIRKSDVTLVCPPYVSPSIIYANPAYNCDLAKHLSYIQAVKDLAYLNRCYFADAYTPMLNGGGDALVQGDGVHPNTNGHQIIARAVLNASYI